MANGGADIFMILLRPSRVPVTGEAVSHLFQGQVLIESLRWNLHNENERKNAEGRDDAYNKRKYLVGQSGSIDTRARHAWEDSERELRRAGKAMQKAQRDAADDDERDEIYADYLKQADAIRAAHKETFNEILGHERARTKDELRYAQRQSEVDEAERNRNFEITFTKRVDIASTQLLNSMKAGDVFPSGTLTIHKRSSTVMDGTSLVFTIQKIRLLDYQLQVAVTDTMTEMMEEWTCEFGALAYVYKNPPSHYSHGNAGQAAAKTASQGTMRAFTMKNIGSPI
ncbi:MAG: type VI secretion system tube protein Hcp [Roseateles sp.]|uniref:type VI secretion system tube protein Hcp n=1 Tax=Roseateles sp. TaxID=1971397 RepID=UPI00403603F8